MATFTAGTSFTDGVTGDVTAAKLNALVANATPLSNFITDRTAETSIATDDLVLISDTSDSGALNKMTVANFTNIVSTGTGTAADPAIRPTGDTNTGIFFPAADTIAFSEGGAESMRIDSSGNVGVKNTSPSTTFSATGGYGVVIGDGTGAPALALYGGNNLGQGIYFGDSNTGATAYAGYIDYLHQFDTLRLGTVAQERLRIDSDGNVGIGTTTPSAKLDVNGEIRTSSNIIRGTGSDLLYVVGGSANNNNNIYIGGGSASTPSTVAITTAGTERLRIDSNGRVGIGTSSPASLLELALARTDTAGSGALTLNGTQKYSFRCTSSTPSNGLAIDSFNGTSWSTPLVIDNSGRVGIGTSSPRGRFEASDAYLSGETGAQCIFPLSVTIGYGGSGYGSIGYNLDYRSATSNTTGVKYLVTDTISQLEFNAGGFIFRNAPSGTSGNTATLTERLRITSGGEVYIAGTTDQGAYNLQVNGTGVWGAGAYVNGSDERLKENIQDITSGLDVVEKLRPVSFQYKEEYTADRSIQSGFIAQDLLVALEGKNYLEGVVSQGPTYYNVAYQNLIPILAKAIQELKTINNSQAQTITSLESRITALEAA